MLLEDGTFEGGEGAPRTRVVLSRALCRFKLFPAGAGLTASQFARAARTFAEAEAPFADTGSLVLKTPVGASIWYWDRARLAALGVHGAREVSPESVWKPSGEGWRVVACAEGFEAQYWQDGALIASSWRRGPFVKAQWTAFALSVDGATLDAPEEPPMAMLLENSDGNWRRNQIKPPLGWRDVERGAATLALCGAALAAFFVGQALNHDRVATEERSAAAQIEARLRADPDIARVRERLALVRAYGDVMIDTHALSSTADAFEVFHRLELDVTAWSAEGAQFRAIVAAPQGPVREIVAALEATPTLCGVTPEIGGADGSVEFSARIMNDAAATCEPALRGRQS
jgi:hypothetical protein